MFIGSLSMFTRNTRKLFVSVQDLMRERSCLINVAIWFVVIVHLLSYVWLSVTSWTATCQASLSFIISWSFLKLMSIVLMMPSNHLILCHPLLLLPSIFPGIRVFSNELALHLRWPKYCSFSTSPSNEYSGLISFAIDWFDLPAVQGTLKSLLQNHSLKASVLQCPFLFMVQFSHPYMTTGKNIFFTLQTLVGKVMSLLFNTLSRFVIALFPRSKCLNFMAAVSVLSDSGAQENKICHCFHFSPFYLPWSDRAGCHDLSFLNVEFKLSQLFHSLLSPSSRGSLVPLHFLPLEWYHLHIWGCWYFSRQSWFQLVIYLFWHFAWCTL